MANIAGNRDIMCNVRYQNETVLRSEILINIGKKPLIGNNIFYVHGVSKFQNSQGTCLIS